MFELSVALKYLLPKWRQLSVSIISLISIVVISLVVWLIVVFFSVTYGLEESWVNKLVALTAPVRVTPTKEYYQSYYYLSDHISSASDYTLKTIGEKQESDTTDPYNPDFDEQIPFTWPAADRDGNGNLKDLVKLAYEAIDVAGDLQAREYEMTSGMIKLNLIRGAQELYLTQSMFLNSFDPENSSLPRSLLPMTDEDAQNLIAMNDFDIKKYRQGPLKNLPTNSSRGEGVLLPKSFHEAGVLIGDQGKITYQVPTASTLQEQQVPVYVIGFYDPGILPMGGKVALLNQDTVSMIRTSIPPDESPLSNGINVRFDDYSRADDVKNRLQMAFKEKGIDSYWKIETFREFDFSKDLLQQLRSEKNLFTLISIVIIIVACSNIISMLIILVNDKKLEIGILRSMGATSKSIAVIFGFCGMKMGLIGSVAGILVAILTLHNLQSLIDFISYAQGFEMFNPMIYGETLPNQLSMKTLVMVLISTGIVSLLAGIVPAVKASMMRPSEILRSE